MAVKEAFSLSEQLLARPDELLLGSGTPLLKERVFELTKGLFTELQWNKVSSCSPSHTKRKRQNSPSNLVPLHQLHPDQVFEQIERIAKPVLDKLKAVVARQTNSVDFELLVSQSRNANNNATDGDDGNSEDEEAGESAEVVEKRMDSCFLTERKEEKVELESNGSSSQRILKTNRRKSSKAVKQSSALDDAFFKLDEMEEFIRAGERMKDAGEGENGDHDDGNEDMSDEDRALELLLDGFDMDKETRRTEEGDYLANDNDTDIDSENEDRGRDDENISNDEDTNHDEDINDDEDSHRNTGMMPIDETPVERNVQNSKSSLMELLDKDRQLHAAIEQMEMELIGKKHWSLMGEAKSKQRDTNSLLSLHLELPQYHYQGNHMIEELPDALGIDVDGTITRGNESALVSMVSNEIERLVKQRIIDLAFDDVERRYESPPSEKPHLSNDDPLAGLDFKKSRTGLADVYAEQYRVELLGGKSKVETELDKQKVAVTQLFAKLMYRLDSLSHQRALPKPLKHKDGTVTDAGAITVEDTIPVTFSESQRLAPEEVFDPGFEKQKNEMSQEERKALRSVMKKRRRKRIVGEVMLSKMTLRDVVKRNLHLQEKNKQAKSDRQSKKASGLTVREHSRVLSPIPNGKRFKGNAVLARALERDQGRNA